MGSLLVQGYRNHTFNICLQHNNEIVAAGLFVENSNQIEMVRYATSKHVVGGFSKILTAYRKYHDKKLVTFADLRWSQGNLYESFFDEKIIIPPDYAYVIKDRRFHKFNFRHKQLSKMEGYDPLLSEEDNTKKMRIYKIYDCGKMKYILCQKRKIQG